MSDFAAYATFVRNKHSKQAEWQDDLMNTVKGLPPELVGAGIGGLGGAATGLFSGNMLRNGLIGAGLGAGAGFGYRHRGDIADLWNGKAEAPAPNPLSKAYNTPQPTTSGVAAPGKPDGKSLGETVGPLKQMGLPTAGGDAKAPSKATVDQQQSAADSAAKGGPEAPITEKDDIRNLNTKAPGNPLTTLMGGKPVGEGDASTDAIESNLGQVPVQPTTREQGVAAAAKRNHVTVQANKLLAPFANSSNPKVQQVKALIEARMPAASPDAPSPEDLASAEGLLASVDNVKAMPGAAADAVGKKIDGAKQIAGEGWDKVKDIAGAPGRAVSNWGKAREEEQKATAAEQAQQDAALNQIIKLLQENQ